ncbi:MAG: mycothiol synthase [Arachnia sp.]
MTDPARPIDPDALEALIRLIAEHDTVSPVNDSARMVLAGQRQGTVLGRHDGDELAGFLVADEREHTLMLGVRPELRRRGHGGALLAQGLIRHPDAGVWAFGSLEPALALARRAGLRATRELLQLGRRLTAEPVRVPPGYTISAFDEEDAAGVVAVNRAAFAHHPEQGALSLSDFKALQAQQWFDPAGLLVAHDAAGRVTGFHWTKRHSATLGEVYVLAVAPTDGGLGLGKGLLQAGLTHLNDVGCREVMLYVEASEKAVVGLYESANFVRITTDTMFHQELP